MRYCFSEKEIKEILNKLVIVIDSREQMDNLIIEWLSKNKHPFIKEKIPFGDYSAMLPKGSFQGQTRNIYFTNDIVIERKFCIDEIAMNLKNKTTNINEITPEIIELLGKKYLEKVLKSDYNRLKQELTSLNKYGIEFFIFMEDKDFDTNIRLGNFRSQYTPEILYKRIKALEREFKTMVRPVDKSNIASEIYNTLKYGVRNVLVHKGYIDESILEVVLNE